MKSIRSKLFSVAFVIILILSVTSIVIFIMHLIVVEKYKAISNNLITEYKLLITTSNLIDAFNLEYRNPSAQNEKAVNDEKIKIDIYIKQLDTAIVNRNSLSDYVGLKNIIGEIVTHVDMGLREIKMGNSSNVTVHYDAAKVQYNFVKEVNTNLIYDELQYSDLLQNQINLFYQGSIAVGGIIILITCLGSVMSIMIFSKKIVAPIQKLRTAAEQIARGDINLVLDNDLLNQNDEIGNLAKSISVMVGQLNEKINKESREKNKVEQILANSQVLQKEIQEEGDKVKAIVTSIGEGLIVFDTDFRIILINPAAEKLLEVNGLQVVGKRVDELIPKIFKNGKESPESRPSIKALAGVSVNITIDDNISFGLISGKQIPVAVTTTSLRRVGKIITGVVEVFRDITLENKSRSEIEQMVNVRTKELFDKNVSLNAAKDEINHGLQQIQLEKTQLMASINSISLGFVMFDNVGKVQYLNTAFKKIVSAKQEFKDINEIDVALGNAFSVREKFEKCVKDEQKIDIKEIEINGKDYVLHMDPIFTTDNSFTVIGVVLLLEV